VARTVLLKKLSVPKKQVLQMFVCACAFVRVRGRGRVRVCVRVCERESV